MRRRTSPGEFGVRAAQLPIGGCCASDENPELGLSDSVIAATGLVYNESVVTDDRSDFDTIDGFDCISVSA